MLKSYILVIINKGMVKLSSYSVFLPSYSVGADAYDKVKKICSNYGKTIIVIGGKTSMEKAKEKIKAAISDSQLEILNFVWYGGDSSFENVEMLKKNLLVHKADMIFAVGLIQYSISIKLSTGIEMNLEKELSIIYPP